MQSRAYESSAAAHAGAQDDSALIPAEVSVDQSVPPFVVEARTQRDAVRAWAMARTREGAVGPLTELRTDEAGLDLPVQHVVWRAGGTRA